MNERGRSLCAAVYSEVVIHGVRGQCCETQSHYAYAICCFIRLYQAQSRVGVGIIVKEWAERWESVIAKGNGEVCGCLLV